MPTHTPQPTTNEFNANKPTNYHHAIKTTLSTLSNLLDAKFPSLDIDEKDGVLTFTVPRVGVFVYNQQPPTKQLWVSSPLSGPAKFNWKGGLKWQDGKSGVGLMKYVNEEVKKIDEAIAKKNGK